MPDYFESLEIQSHRGIYKAHFHSSISGMFDQFNLSKPVFLVDEKVVSLHNPALSNIIERGPVIKVKAIEDNKSLEKMPAIMYSLLEAGIRRGDTLVVIGGGIVQDIGCFIASTLFRGLEWVFLPTTLLAQADSCIGSKSSINMLGHKNIVGTFNPPNEVHICTAFLDSLSDIEIRSGIGEMLKVHMLDSMASLTSIVENYDALLTDRKILMEFLYQSLEIKKRYIEKDEFDKGIRNLLNYGHSFGHAIEAATHFRIPHGIAVTMGMDIANYVAQKTSLGTSKPFMVSHNTMKKNYHGFENEPIPLDGFKTSLAKDKKNIADLLTLILPNQKNELEKIQVEKTEEFWALCAEFFEEIRAS